MPREIIIDDENWKKHVDYRVDGRRMSRGLVKRDLDKFPVGCYAAAPAWGTDIKLIPRSEWSARIKEMEETKTRLSDIRNIGNRGRQIPSLDQNGQGYCVTEDTEYLTPHGWVPVAEYEGNIPVATIDPYTNRLQYQLPSIVHRYEYDGEMIYSTNRRVDFGVTPNHRMYLRKWDEGARSLSSGYSFALAKDIGWYAGLLHAPTPQIGTHFEELAVPGFAAFTGDDLFALLGLIVSDGFAGGAEKNRNVVSFASFRGIPEIEQLALRCGFRRKESNKSVWVCTSHEFADWIRENCYCGHELGASNKCVPRIVKAATPRQIGIFLQFFDDRNRESTQFFTGSKRLADDLQELHMLVGKRSHIGVRDPRETKYDGNRDGVIRSRLPQYVLTVAGTDSLCIDRKKHIESERYKGMVYCVTVPNGTIVTRRNNSVLYSGNCWAYGTASAVTLLRALQGLPYRRLSAHAIGCMVKGYRDQGGWGAQSLDFVKERGIPDVDHWAEKSMSRSNDRPETWVNARKHRVTEGFVELNAPVYDRDLTFDQKMTCLLNRIPVVCDYMWWGHCVCAADPVEVEPGSFGSRDWNSWGDGWSAKGMGIIRGDKAVPDNAVAPRVATAA